MSFHTANKNAALRLAAAGIPVFPAKIFREGKSDRWVKPPCITDWQNKATTDPLIIEAWWEEFPDAVPAIPLSSVGLVAIDLDRHHADVDGIENFDKLMEGQSLPNMPIVLTASYGGHLYFRQPESGKRLGNSSGSLPPGIDVRGDGGFVIAPGAVRPDGAIYEREPDSPDLAEAFREGTIPTIPASLEEIIRRKPPLVAETKSKPAEKPPVVGAREKLYSRGSLEACAREVENAVEGERNDTLNSVSYRMGKMVAVGWIGTSTIQRRLSKAAQKCGLIDKDGGGAEEAYKTINSGLRAGAEHPHPPLEPAPPPLAVSSGGISLRWAGSKDWPRPKWLIHQLIPETAVGLIVGESQAGKSFVCMSLAGAVAVGKPFLTKEVKKTGGTVYVCAEGFFSVGERLEAEFAGSIAPYLKEKSRDADLSKIPIAVLSNIPNLVEEEELESLIAKVLKAKQQMKEKHGVELQLVIIDTMIAAIGLDDWNNAAHAQKAMSVLHRIARETGAVTVGVHHHGKDKSRGAVGSYAFTASADFIISVHRQADENGRVKKRWASITKSRRGETGWECDFQLAAVQIGVGAAGEPILCAYVNPDTSSASMGHTDIEAKLNKNKGLSLLMEKFKYALGTEGEMKNFPGGTLRAVRKSFVRPKFDESYGGSKEANRKAFERALDIATSNRDIMVSLKDGEEWLCDPRIDLEDQKPGSLFEQ